MMFHNDLICCCFVQIYWQNVAFVSEFFLFQTMALSNENNEYKSCGENRIIALHKLYQDNGKSFFSAKSESIYDSVSKGNI